MNCLPPVPHAKKGRLPQAMGLQGLLGNVSSVVTRSEGHCAACSECAARQRGAGLRRGRRPRTLRSARRRGQHHSEGEAREQPAWLQVAVLLFCWGVFVMFTLPAQPLPALQRPVLGDLWGAGRRLPGR